MVCPLHQNVSAGNAVLTSSPLSRSMLTTGTRGQRVGRVSIGNAFDGSRSTSTATITRAQAGDTGTIRVKVSPPREISQPPAPPSLIHSPVYVQKALIKPSADSSTAGAASSSLRLADVEDEQDDGNSLMWALKQVDRSLDELEQNPLPLQKEIYELSRSPVGNATSSALTTAAKVTVAATKEAVKAALPVGQWMVREGAKAAISLMSKAAAESAKAQKQQQQRPGSSAGSAAQAKQGSKKRK